MSWTYVQRTGALLDPAGQLVALGYSGRGADKNNPDEEAVKGMGPLPQGTYGILPPVNTMTHGPYVLWLVPDPGNDMLGRSGFGIHGDSVVDPGNASEGCIVMPLFARMKVAQSGDTKLQVIANL